MSGVRVTSNIRTASDHEVLCRLQQCPNFPQWDADCRAQALPERIEQHLLERKKVFERSVYACMNFSLQILVLYYDEQTYANLFRYHQHQNHVCSECSAIDCQEKEHRNNRRNKKCFNCEIAYEIAPGIMANALRASDQKRMAWSGIQISQCINPPKTYKKLVAIAINHQDQISWEFTANDLYVPAIDAALAMFRRFVNRLPLPIFNRDILRNAVIELLGCGLALFLLIATTKFKRTKPKPVMRPRTLLRSGELRNAFLRCCLSITIDIWIDQETRKQSCGRFDSDGNSLKRNVCEEVHLKTRKTCLDLFVEKCENVCRLLGVPLPQPFLNQIIKDSRPPKSEKSASKGKGKGKMNKKKKKKSQQLPLPLPTIINSKKNNYRSKPVIINGGGRTSTSTGNCTRIGRDFQPSNDFLIDNRERRRAELRNRRQRSRERCNKHHYNTNNNGNGRNDGCSQMSDECSFDAMLPGIFSAFDTAHPDIMPSYVHQPQPTTDLEMQRHLRERQGLYEENQRLNFELANVRRLYDMEMRARQQQHLRERQILYEENKRLKMQLANNMRNTMMSNQNHHLMPRSVPCYTTNNNNNNINNNANAQQLQQQQQWCPTLTNTHPMVHTTTTTNMANSASAAATSSPNVAESMSAIIDEDMTFPTIGNNNNNNNNSRVEGVPEELPLGSMNSGSGVLSSNLKFNFNVNLGLNSYLGSVPPFMDRGYSGISSGFCPPI